MLASALPSASSAAPRTLRLNVASRCSSVSAYCRICVSLNVDEPELPVDAAGEADDVEEGANVEEAPEREPPVEVAEPTAEETRPVALDAAEATGVGRPPTSLLAWRLNTGEPAAEEAAASARTNEGEIFMLVLSR